MHEGLPLDGRRQWGPKHRRQHLPSGLDASLCPAPLLGEEGLQRTGQLGRYADLIQIHEAPSRQLGSIADIQVFGEGIGLPATCVLQGSTPPHPGRSVEVEETTASKPAPLFEGEVPVQQYRLRPSQPAVRLVQVVPPGLDHAHGRVLERREQSVQEIRRGEEIGVQYQQELAPGPSQPRGEGTRLVPRPVASLKVLDRNALGAPVSDAGLRQRARFVRGIIEHLNLEGIPGILQPGHRIDQAFDHMLLVEDRKLHRDRGQHSTPAALGQRGRGLSGKRPQVEAMPGERQQEHQCEPVDGDGEIGEEVGHAAEQTLATNRWVPFGWTPGAAGQTKLLDPSALTGGPPLGYRPSTPLRRHRRGNGPSDTWTHASPEPGPLSPGFPREFEAGNGCESASAAGFDLRSRCRPPPSR